MKGKRLGDAIRERRKVIGLTQDELAKKVGGISRPGVQKWESGTIPDSSKWDDIEDALQVDEGWLVSMLYEGGAGLQPPPEQAIRGDSPSEIPPHRGLGAFPRPVSIPSGKDPPALPAEQEADDKLPTHPEAMEMTKEVLASKTIFRGALLQNIKAFHRAVRGEKEMASLRDQMQDMTTMMTTMMARLERIEQNTAVTAPTPAQKRDVQGG